jgi:hypothetical protein
MKALRGLLGRFQESSQSTPSAAEGFATSWMASELSPWDDGDMLPLDKVSGEPCEDPGEGGRWYRRVRSEGHRWRLSRHGAPFTLLRDRALLANDAAGLSPPLEYSQKNLILGC